MRPLSTQSHAPSSARRGASRLLAGALLALSLAACSGSDPAPEGSGATAAKEAIEWYDPDSKLLRKSEGKKLFGQWVGPRTWWHQNQTIAREGQYDDQGRKTGLFVDYHETGDKKSETTFVEDLAEGPFVEWHPSGEKIGEGLFARGEKVGEWKAWYPDGSKRKTEIGRAHV